MSLSDVNVIDFELNLNPSFEVQCVPKCEGNGK